MKSSIRPALPRIKHNNNINILVILILLFTTLSATNHINSLNNISETNSSSFEKGKNLILNGDFEEGCRYFFSSLNYSTQEVMPGNYTVTKNASKHNLAFASIPDHTSGSGNYLIIDASPDENSKSWCSKIKIEPQSEYLFSLFACNINTHYSKPANIALMINGNR
jgi:hypothetical protein